MCSSDLPADAGQQLIQELAGAADEGETQLILALARALAHEHQVARGGAAAGDGPGAPAREVVGGGHATRVRGRSTRARGESGGVRKLIVIGVVAILAILFVQPIRAYRSAKDELDSARTELKQARVAKARALAEREALGTRAVLVRDLRGVPPQMLDARRVSGAAR